MALFISTTTNRIDKKGRVSVPALFRNNLSGNFAGVVLFRSLQSPLIEGCDYDRLMRLSTQLETGLLSQASLQSTSPITSNNETLTNNKDIMTHNPINPDYAAMMFAEAQMLSFDAEGRISIPPSLLTHANIIDQITFVGRGATFELWEPEAFIVHHEQMRQRLLMQASRQQGGIHG